MIIDLNNLSRIAYYRETGGQYKPSSFGKCECAANDLLYSIDNIIDDLKDTVFNNHQEFSNSYIELLQQLLSIAYLKNIDLNKYIRMEIPVDKKVIEYC